MFRAFEVKVRKSRFFVLQQELAMFGNIFACSGNLFRLQNVRPRLGICVYREGPAFAKVASDSQFSCKFQFAIVEFLNHLCVTNHSSCLCTSGSKRKNGLFWAFACDPHLFPARLTDPHRKHQPKLNFLYFPNRSKTLNRLIFRTTATSHHFPNLEHWK